MTTARSEFLSNVLSRIGRKSLSLGLTGGAAAREVAPHRSFLSWREPVAA